MVEPKGFKCRLLLETLGKTPVTVTPQQKISKTLNFQNSLKILNLYFWADHVYFWGDNVYFGKIRFTLPDS